MTMTNVVLYDGDCGFCNFWVKWILKRDQKKIFSFAALQGEYGQQFLMKNQLNTQHFDTLYVIENDSRFYSQLDAVIYIASQLGGIYTFAKILKLLPLSLRNKLYQTVSKNRKKIMQDQCYLPSAEERKLFLN